MSALYQRPARRRELNLVPLIDILVMLVFFAFVTMQFKTAYTMNIRLPKIDSAGKSEYKGPVTIGIDKAGTYFFNGKAATEAQMTDLLGQVSQANKDQAVLIRADEDVPVKKLTWVMDACQKAGLNNFKLQAR
jgi:biopolymer transport protein ExbD